MDRIGRYDIVRLLGEGATSRVYLAFDSFAQKQVALKHIHAGMLRHPAHGNALRQQLQNEAALAGRLKHPHIAEVYDASFEDEHVYLAMEYVAGGTLETFCHAQNLLDFDRLIEILFKITRALEYAYLNGVIHRDIKPANLLLANSEGTEVKVSDFGAALLEDLDRTEVVGVGSPAYMSPEQVRHQALTHTTDIYSVGVVMYQLLCGRLPYDSRNQLSLAYQIAHSDTVLPSQLRPGIPQEFDDIVMKAMHKDPQQRYATWLEFSQDLAQLARSRRLSARQQPISETQRFHIMRDMPFFKDFDDVEIWETLRLSQWREAASGAMLMREGDKGGHFAILASGTASIQSQGHVLHVLASGECFGEMSMFLHDKGIRSADVVATSDCSLIEIRADVLSRASNACQTRFYRAFLETLAQRLAHANHRIVRL